MKPKFEEPRNNILLFILLAFGLFSAFMIRTLLCNYENMDFSVVAGQCVVKK